MQVRTWFRPPRRLFALFMAVIVVPAATLAWLASRTLQQDRALERQAVRDRLERAAASVAAELRQRLDALAADLPSFAGIPESRFPRDSLLVTLTRDGVSARPRGRLLYYPTAPHGRAPSLGAFARAETAEYRDHDPSAAATQFRALAATPEPDQRAAALVALARCLREEGRPEAAISVYEQLARVDARIDDVPAELVARHARAGVLAALKRHDAVSEALALAADLRSGRWVLDRATYEMYRQETAAWLPSDEVVAPDAITTAMSEATAALAAVRPWEAPGRAEGRTALWAGGTPVFAVWQTSPERTLVLLVPASWISDSSPTWRGLNVSIAVVDPDGHRVLGDPLMLARPLVVRQPGDTRLPWVLHVATADAAIDAAVFASRRELVLGIVLFVGVLVLGAAVVVLRSMSRDEAVRRTQAEFVATVSHEFRSPLTSMSHLIEMLESGDVTAEDRRRRYYSVLGRETRRLRRLVENLLDFRRMEVGRVEYRSDELDAVELVRSVAEEFATELGSRDRVLLSLERVPVPIRGDREALARAIWNLLDNAAKYSPPASPIRLELGVNGQVATIAVIDCGVGIPASERGDVFRPFYRGASAAASAVKGTGIGLATVAHIVRAHGGEVSVASEGGAGSTFTMTVPVHGHAMRAGTA